MSIPLPSPGSAVGKHALMCRYHGADSAEAREARRLLNAANIAASIKKITTDGLTAEQKRALSELVWSA